MVLDVSVKGGDHPRTTLVLGNRTGRIESAPFWSGKDEMIRGVAKGMLVQVVGKVTTYRDSAQLDATSVRPLPKGTVPLTDLVPNVGPVDKYWQYVDDSRAKLTAPRLRAVVDLFYADDAFRERYEQCPGAPGTGHHAALGGLLQHTCEVMRIGQQIARVAKADEELIVAGALLHDIGKTECYSWETGVFDTNERGRLIGHVVQGVIMLERALGPVSHPRLRARPTSRSFSSTSFSHTTANSNSVRQCGRSRSKPRSCTLPTTPAPRPRRSPMSMRRRICFPGRRACRRKRVWQLDNRWMCSKMQRWDLAGRARNRR